MNNYFRKILIARIKKALLDANDSSEINHPYLIGKLREIVLNELIAPLLNNRYSIGSGKIVDYQGAQSKEMDLCLYSTMIHPPLFFSSKNDLGIFPIESVLGCVEVKSIFNNDNLKDAYEKFKHVEDNLIMTAGFHNEFEMPLPHIYVKHKYSFFSFKTGITKYSPDSILNFYSKIDPNWNSDPLITSICLANSGWICYTVNGWLHMPYDKKNEINEEIVAFLSTLIQDLPKVEFSRGIPRIGYYLTDPTTTGRFKDGQLVKNPWNKKGFLSFSNTKID